MKPKCPICKVPMEEDGVYDNDIHQTVEEYERCSDGCKLYSYEFAYGASREVIGGREVVWSYDEGKTKRHKRLFARRKILLQARKRWSRNET